MPIPEKIELNKKGSPSICHGNLSTSRNPMGITKMEERAKMTSKPSYKPSRSSTLPPKRIPKWIDKAYITKKPAPLTKPLSIEVNSSVCTARNSQLPCRTIPVVRILRKRAVSNAKEECIASVFF